MSGSALLRRALAFADARPVTAVFVVAFTVRALVAVGVFVLSDGWLFGDDLRYSELAAARADGDEAFAALSPYWGPETYTRTLFDLTEGLLTPITALYEVFGHWKLAGQLFIAALGAGTAAVTVRLAAEFLPGRWPLAAGLSVALLPSQVLFSSLILKDAPVWLAMATLALVVALALRSAGVRLALTGMVALALLLYLGNLRWQTMVIAAWALGLASLFGIHRQWVPRVGGALLLAVFVPYSMGHGHGGLQSIRERGDLAFARAANALNASTPIEPASPPDAPPGRGESARSAPAPPAPTEPAEPAAPAEPAVAPSRAGSAPEPPAPAEPAVAPSSDESSQSATADRQVKPSEEAAPEGAGAAVQPASEPAPDEQPEPPESPAQIAEQQAEVARESVRLTFGQDEGFTGNLNALPRGLSVVLLEPLPWQASESASLNMAKLEDPAWYLLVLLGLVGLLSLRPRHLRVFAFPLLAGGASLLAFALSEGNVGTAFRHRGELVWVVVLLAALGASRLRERVAGRSQLPMRNAP